MSIVTDTFTLVVDDPELLEIDYRSSRVTAVGPLEVNERLWLERANVPLLIAALRSCLSRIQAPPTSVKAGNDSLSIGASGHEAEPYINLENRRPAHVPRPGYAWFAMSAQLAHRMLAELESLVIARPRPQ